MDILERLLLPFRGFFFASTSAIPDLGGGDAGDGGGGGDGRRRGRNPGRR